MLRYLPFILVLAVWIYAFIDCLNTPEKEVRKLPKVAWVLIILLFGQVLLGPIAWFAVGRPRRNAPYGATKPDERRWVAPDDNPDFLKSLGKDSQPRGPQAGGEDGQDSAADSDETPAADGGASEAAGTKDGSAPVDNDADTGPHSDTFAQEAEEARRREERTEREKRERDARSRDERKGLGSDEPPAPGH